MTPEHVARCRHWAIRLTERASVTGTSDEASFGPWMADELRQAGSFGDGADIWSFPVAAGDPRHCVALFLRGNGPKTVLLTGHYDTVTVQDYGDLRELAIRPETLLEALRDRLDNAARTPAEILAKADFAKGDYLPGRGLLDMKAGLAAGLAVCEGFAAAAAPVGNLLFLAVPDEENASAGARAAAPCGRARCAGPRLACPPRFRPSTSALGGGIITHPWSGCIRVMRLTFCPDCCATS